MKHAKPMHLPYKCGICGKKLTSKQNLFQHISIHTGEKPLRCPFSGCSASFKHASQLSSHKSIHFRNLPNRLDFSCLKSFIWLLLELFSSENQSDYTLPIGQYTADEAHLPPLKPDVSNKLLPEFSTFNPMF